LIKPNFKPNQVTKKVKSVTLKKYEYPAHPKKINDYPLFSKLNAEYKIMIKNSE